MAKVEYQWDGDQLVGQQRYLADGSAARETQWIYEPGSFRPLAQVEGQSGNTQLHYIVTDLTGTARELCSEEGEIHWRGDQQLWGQHQETRTPMALRRFIGDAANDETGCDLRYQGQLYDAESGLYYNRHRYYDPEIGQYISPDPIGLGGGLRPQGYVHNPVDWVDPRGLAVCSARYEKYKKYREQGYSAQDASRLSKPYSNPANRPAYGKGQVDDVWNSAKQADGNVYDPNTGELLTWDKGSSRAGQWDMGHTSGNEYRKLHGDYMIGKITKNEFLSEYRNPANYRPESINANRSHMFEEP